MDESIKDEILQAAKEEFLTFGYQEASMRNIASKAKLTTGSLYYRFIDKAELFDAIIQEAISKVTKNKTVIVIAHRMRTVENADHIIVLKEGKIIEEGKPTDLIQKQKEFAKMVQLQKESSSWSI